MNMTEAKYKVSLTNLKDYIKMLKLKVIYSHLYEKTSIAKYSKETIGSLCRSSDLSYDELYKKIMINEDYDLFIPEDYGIFQFYIEKKKNKVSKVVYCYYSNSRDFCEIKELFEDDECSDMNPIMIYEYLIDDAPEKRNIIYFRYDYDPAIYNGIIHASSHLHIGWDNEIRIPIKYMLTPEMFVDFIAKNVYKDFWQEALMNAKFKDRVLKMKKESDLIDKCMFNDEENKILHIS